MTKTCVAKFSLTASASALVLALFGTGAMAQVQPAGPIDGIGETAITADLRSCQTTHALASENSDTSLEVRFINQTEGALTAYWIDYEGQPKDIGTIAPGEQLSQQTFLTHPWTFADETGACVVTLLPQEGVEAYIIGASQTATSLPPGVVITADTLLDETVAYPPLRLLAYSINDGQRAGDGALTGYFAADVDGFGTIVEGEQNATVLQIFASGTDSVMFVNMANPEGPVFLGVYEDEAAFDPSPTDASYFIVRPPLEPDAAKQGFVSFESKAFPGQYLRHSGFRLMLDPIDTNSDSLSRRDATFLVLADGAEIPSIGDPVDVLTTTVTEIATSRQVTLETAIYETLQNNFFLMESSDTVELSFVVTLLTSLYEVNEEVATNVVLTVFRSTDVTSITNTVTVESIVKIVEARTSSSRRYYLADHFDSLNLVDMGKCGIETGGFGGFGKGRVPTNSHGDVHIFTPDGLAYDFQDGGEFTLVASADGFVEVQTRQSIHDEDPSVSSNTAVAIRFGTDVLEFYSDKEGQRTYFAGQLIDLPGRDSATGPELQLGNGGSVLFDGDGKSGPRYLVTAPDGDFTVRVNMYAQFLNVGVSASVGTFSGLIGNLDGNPLNDMLPRRGAELVCPPADGPQLVRFGDSWRVTIEETLLRAELDESHVSVATEIGTGRRVSIETAVFETLEANITSTEAVSSVEVSVIVSQLTEVYEVSEEEALIVVMNLFEERGVSAITDTIEVATISEVVEVYNESREVRTIETLDVTVRAKAQRICEANGVTDPLALANCALDVAATQSETFVQSAVSFQEVIVEVPRQRRQIGTSVSNPLSPEAVLPPERVIEIVGPPDVVPSFEELVVLVQQVRTAELSRKQTVTETEIREERIVTEVTSDITSTVDLAACTEVGGLQSPTQLLEANPAAGGVTIYCATHAGGGQTVTVELGRTLDEATEKAALSCPAEAASRVADFGDIVIPCREIGRAEREFDFGGGVLAMGRDVQVTLSERRIEKTELLQLVENFSLVLSPVPGLTAQCLAGDSIPIRGLTVTDGLLDYTDEGESDFQNLCGEISMEETADDFMLQATCFNDDATDATPSAISLLSIAAIEELVSHPACAPEPVNDGLFKAFAEDGLEVIFPERGDLVLIRSVGWETSGSDESSDPGIVVNARRDVWVADKSESVFTALSMRVGSDLVEVHAMPEPAILINGLPLEDAVGTTTEGEMMVLPGGGSLRIEEDGVGPAAYVVTWPIEIDFAIGFVIYPGSHVIPAIRAGEAYEYEGLARFTADWMLTEEDAGFTLPLGMDPTCECGEQIDVSR